MHDSTEIPFSEPLEVYVGDSWKWKKSGDHYPPATWTLTYTLTNASGKITITAANDSGDFLISVAPAVTATYQFGKYRWQAAVSNGTDRYVIAHGSIEIKPDYANSNLPNFDDRTHTVKVLEAIEATIEKRATHDQLNTTIRGTAISRIPIADLITFRSYYLSLLSAEEQADRVSQGLPSGRKILVRFP